jgi:hypothetical protein
MQHGRLSGRRIAQLALKERPARIATPAGLVVFCKDVEDCASSPHSTANSFVMP